MKTMSRMALGLSIFTLLFFSSCQKESETPNPEQEEFAAVASESDAEAEVIFNGVFDDVVGVNAEVGFGGTGNFGGASPSFDAGLNSPTGIDSNHCFVVTVKHLSQDTTFPVQITIDFGAGCTGRDGKIRKGKVITEYSDRLIYPEATATTTFDGFYVNDVKVEGTHQITNLSTSNALKFEVSVNGKLSKENGNFTEWTSTRSITHISGLATPFDPRDDVFGISGEASGFGKRGDKIFEWETAISSPLIKKFSCRWIVQGAIIFRKGASNECQVDYGNGDCDNKATLTVNGKARIISLH